MEIRQRLIDSRPKQSWEEFVERMPLGKAPSIKEICDRWGEYEQQTVNRNGKEIVVRGASKDNGEQRAYLAWALGVMEPEEERYFGMLTIRHEQLVVQAIVPTLRALVAYAEQLETWNAKVANELRTAQAVRP